MLRLDEFQGAPDPAQTHRAWKRRLATLLGITARAFTGLRPHRGIPPELAFYAEAAAPEGALYVPGPLPGQRDEIGEAGKMLV